VSGRKLTLALKDAGATQRALVAADIAAGRLIITPLTKRWANRVAGANERHAKVARSLLPLERAAVRRGQLDLNKHQPISDDKLDKLFAETGFDRWFATVERATAPTAVAAE
jgi:hypothetical protein